MPDPLDEFFVALRGAQDLYVTDNIASRIAAVDATISYLREVTDGNNRSVTTPLMDVLGKLVDEQEQLNRMANADEDGKRQGKGNTKPIMTSLNDAVASAVITLAMRAGKSSGVAATMVAECLGSGAHDSQAVKQLLQSRKNLMDKRASPAALQQYDRMIASAAKARKAGMTPNETVALVLDFLSEKITPQSS